MFVWSISPIAFSVLSLDIYWYGIIYAFALFTSWAVATYILRKLRANGVSILTKEEFDNFMFWAIVSIVVGARLGHVLFFEIEYYLKNPFEILMLRQGGLSFHGAIIGLGLYLYAFVRKRNFSWKLFADVLCLSGALGIGIGRLANFMNQELYGKIATVDCAVIFSLVDNMPRYPTQIFESFFEGFLNFWILFIIFRIKGITLLGTGIFTSVFCIVYSSSRFIIEFFKEVETYTYFNSVTLTTGQTLSIAMFLFGVYIAMLQKSKTYGS
jgi:phosphatidylglycerol:prolipoprotein diacylglycerol transferase